MSPSAANAVFGLGIAALFYLDRDRDSRTSPAVWLAVAWFFIGGSRMVSQWLAGELPVGPLDAYLEGSPLDRWLLSGLIGTAMVILIARARDSGPSLRANAPLVIFFLYCALSVLWSDYPFVAVKRWTKALGNLTMVMLVLTESDPVAAVKRAFAHTGFLLIPMSVLLIKYYPVLGRQYNRWTWSTSAIGVATDKNGLGALCLVFGLASLWRFLEASRDTANLNRRRLLTAHGAIVGMVVWLLIKADSSTSLTCFALGGLVLLLTLRPGGLRPARVNAIVGTLAVAGLLAFGFQDLYTYVVEGLGRNTTLTGRTDIWSDLFTMTRSPLIGTGFESFWLGSRAEYLWNKYYFHPNQAHNGYIETYINLGWIGVALLIILVVSGYRNILRMDREDTTAGSLRLAFFLVALVYNITEAAFKVMHPVWIAFLLASAAWPALPQASEQPERSADTVPLPWAFGQSVSPAADLPPALTALQPIAERPHQRRF